MEALACQVIFDWAEQGRIALVWSFMHLDETVLCPFPERARQVLELSTLCKVRVGPEEPIREMAARFSAQGGCTAKDALHLACAAHCKAHAFLSCDDRLVVQAKRLALDIQIMNPVDYVRQVLLYEQEDNNG